MSIRRPMVLVLAGPNGSGKSTNTQYFDKVGEYTNADDVNVLTSMLLERLVQKTDRYHLSWSDQLMITTASALHDIGKMGINENILNKPGRLTKEEFEEMKKHTLIGASMLKSLELYQDEKLVQIAYQICRWHHERYDGKGYPDGLKGEEIPIAAQVVSIADVYDALTSERVYKSAYTQEKAIEMILNGECPAATLTFRSS